MPSIYYRHVDGGYYRLTCHARHCDDLTEQVVYEHLWPFTPGYWVRPLSEFQRRFTAVPESEWLTAQTQSREEAQERITRQKAQRRATEKANPHAS